MSKNWRYNTLTDGISGDTIQIMEIQLLWSIVCPEDERYIEKFYIHSIKQEERNNFFQKNFLAKNGDTIVQLWAGDVSYQG